MPRLDEIDAFKDEGDRARILGRRGDIYYRITQNKKNGRVIYKKSFVRRNQLSLRKVREYYQERDAILLEDIASGK